MKKILNIILITYVLVFGTLLVLKSNGTINALFLQSALYAGLLNLINTAIAVVLFEITYKQKNKTFLIANLGGMSGRMVLMLALIVVILKSFEVHEVGFLLIFFVIYFIFLSSEVNYFHLKMKNKKNEEQS